MRPLPGPVFTVDQAFAAGWTHSALKNALRHGRIARVRRGVYAVPGAVCTAEAFAVTAAVPHAVVSHRSATLGHGLPIVGPRPAQPEITVPPRASTNLAGVHTYRAGLRPHDVIAGAAGPITSPARTVVDVARHWPIRTSVVVIDAALYRGLTTLDEIADVLDFCGTWPGIRRARRAVSLADGRAESPLESISRLVIPRLGLPAPEPQKLIFDRYGRLVGRSDFYWDDVGVVGEADGRSKYDGRRILTDEKDRQEDFEDLSLVVVRWGWEHAWSRHDRFRDKLVNGFDRGRRRDRSGFPRLWTL